MPERTIDLPFDPPNPAQVMRAGTAGVVLLLLIIGGWTSYYTIPAESEGVVLRFGRFIDTVPSGLHFKPRRAPKSGQ